MFEIRAILESQRNLLLSSSHRAVPDDDILLADVVWQLYKVFLPIC